MYTQQRTLRIADGPDAVHHLVVGRNELRRYESSDEDVTSAAVWRN
jgi:acyl-CoA dehydrogenase